MNFRWPDDEELEIDIPAHRVLHVRCLTVADSKDFWKDVSQSERCPSARPVRREFLIVTFAGTQTKINETAQPDLDDFSSIRTEHALIDNQTRCALLTTKPTESPHCSVPVDVEFLKPRFPTPQSTPEFFGALLMSSHERPCGRRGKRR